MSRQLAGVRRARRAAGAVVATLTSVVIPVLTASPAHAAATGYRAPVASYTIANPGVIYSGGRFVVLSTTGSWRRAGNISTSPEATGPWTPTTTALLAGQPTWSSADDLSVWAPSEIQIGSTYVVFYAALIRGQKSKRCIGTGTSSSPIGPFTPRPAPLVCITGYGAADPEPGVSAASSTIDATPSYVTIDGERRLYLTYKTQYTKADGSYYTTIRMVRLNIASVASQVLGQSHQLTVRDGNIEENPVLIQRGSTFTLFTSLGGYTLCRYHTEWRQSANIWAWPQTSHTLAFPANTNTCGTGNAQVYPGLPAGSWRIFFNGHYPAQPDPFRLYVGVVSWPNGQPVVSNILS